MKRAEVEVDTEDVTKCKESKEVAALWSNQGQVQ